MIDNHTGLRRVVTGETTEGRSVVVADERIATRSMAGTELYQVWGIPEIPVPLPSEGNYPALHVSSGGAMHVTVGVIPPRTLVGGDNSGHINFDAHAFHKTKTVDIVFVEHGEVVMRVPDSAPLHLKAGESIVQNGAIHSWENTSDHPATVLWAVVKGKR